MEISVTLTKQYKTKSTDDLGFGLKFTDHMFLMDYSENLGWHDARIVPYGSIEFDPATMVFHYGQEVFEGLKAYRGKTGKVTLFRPELNVERLNASAERMCMPTVDNQFLLSAIQKLVSLDRDWIPQAEGTSLYIRPFMIATERGLGVHAAREYKLLIICSPSGAYYANGLEPVSLKVESEYVRASKGGTGHYKFGGNYASSILAGEIAAKEGYDQVMWLDAKERKYVEEVGSMNIFFAYGDKVVTPMLSGSILPGITRRSCIEFLRARSYVVEEKLISIEDVLTDLQNGSLTEVFGTGTAAVISPVGRIGFKGRDYTVASGKMGKIAEFLYENLTGIQTGRLTDTMDWVREVK